MAHGQEGVGGTQELSAKLVGQDLNDVILPLSGKTPACAKIRDKNVWPVMQYSDLFSQPQFAARINQISLELAQEFKEGTAVKLIDDMKNEIDKLFLTKPKADIEVKPVEAFREKSEGGAFYEEPALDGSRPGRYYINLYNIFYSSKSAIL